jgi:alkylation response protein AidB-like acyl-CoA dehydrogenase
MDARDTPEQAELRRTARQLARELRPRTVVELDDAVRRKRLAGAVREAGWLELRHDGGEGAPLASGVEAAIIAEALGEAVADVPFAGPVLAADLARRAGVTAAEGAVVGFARDLIGPAVVAAAATTAPIYAVDCDGESPAAVYVLRPDAGGARLAQVQVDGSRDGAARGSDLTRAVRTIAAGAPVRDVREAKRIVTRADLEAWSALGLALTTADLIGAARGALDQSVAYAKERKQYGVAIGSFQAVQHLLAEALCLLEGASSAALNASWSVDELAPGAARMAGSVAKAYAARAARTVCETAVQVHGGMGNTWECLIHVHLRRALLSTQWFGDDGEQLRHLQRTRLGAA